MILVQEIVQLNDPGNRTLDILSLEWYETTKTIIRRRTKNEKEIAIKKNNRIPLQDGDVLWYSDTDYIKVEIKPCECIIVKPRNITEMGIVCFEIGNMHLPIYIDACNQIHIAYESPLYTFLQKKNYDIDIQEKKLLQTNMLTMHEIKR